MRKSALFITLVVLPLVTRGQQDQQADSIPTRRLDSIGAQAPSDEIVRIESYAARFDPQKALLYSAILPGAGQVYNRAYWKVPIIYGGFFALGYVMRELQDQHKELKDMLFNVLNEPANPVAVNGDTTALGNILRGGQVVSPKYLYNTEQLRARVNRWQRDRDFTVMLTALWYVLQLVEAHVDAHLKEFDVNPQLKVSIEPSIRSNVLTGRTSGLALTFKF
jgi:hypothetical protein